MNLEQDTHRSTSVDKLNKTNQIDKKKKKKKKKIGSRYFEHKKEKKIKNKQENLSKNLTWPLHTPYGGDSQYENWEALAEILLQT